MTRCCRLLVVFALLATMTSTLLVYPHELAYFNEAAGGPAAGHRHLLHSNLDWGQDLLLTVQWLDSREICAGDVEFLLESGPWMSWLYGFHGTASPKYEVISLGRLSRRHSVSTVEVVATEAARVCPTTVFCLYDDHEHPDANGANGMRR
jgi:hypothetical protein